MFTRCDTGNVVLGIYMFTRESGVFLLVFLYFFWRSSCLYCLADLSCFQLLNLRILTSCPRRSKLNVSVLSDDSGWSERFVARP
jgi:hypothetical protein